MEKIKVLVVVSCMLVLGLLFAPKDVSAIDLTLPGCSVIMPVYGDLGQQIAEFGATVAALYPGPSIAEIMEQLKGKPTAFITEILEKKGVVDVGDLLDSERIDPEVAKAMLRGLLGAPDTSIRLKIATTEDVTDALIGDFEAVGFTNIEVSGKREIYADLTPKAFFSGAGEALAGYPWIVSRKDSGYYFSRIINSMGRPITWEEIIEELKKPYEKELQIY